MNLAKIVRFTEKHALITVRRNAFDTTNTVGYVAKAPSIAELAVGSEFPLPEGWSIVSKEDEEGNVLSTKEGEPLSFFTWK